MQFSANASPKFSTGQKITEVDEQDLLNKKIALHSVQTSQQTQREIDRQQRSASIVPLPVPTIDSVLSSSDVLKSIVDRIKAEAASKSLSDFVSSSFSVSQSGQLTSNLPPSSLPVSNDPIERARHPNVVITDSYLNDPIEFSTSKEFFPTVLTLQVPSGTFEQYDRDIAQFVKLTTNSGNNSQTYSVVMTSPLYDRFKVATTFHSDFTEF